MHAHVLGNLDQRAGLPALGGLVASIGRADFSAQALASLNRIMCVGSWSVYQVWHDRPPRMYASASQGVADTTAECFAIYRDSGLYRCDRSFDLVGQQSAGQAVLLRMHATEVSNETHRNAIYLRHAMVERLSLAWMQDDRSLLAVNLYHHAHQGSFAATEMESFADAAAVLKAAVSRHVDWLAEHEVRDTRGTLRRRCCALSERELDVLELLLRGLTYDGIADQLGLALGTVKTYRARAFNRLGIHFKSQLFALSQAPCRPFG